MSSNQEIERVVSQKTFEDIKHVTKEGLEFWFARELQPVLGYKRWEDFERLVIKVNEELVTESDQDHIRYAPKKVKLGSGAERSVDDYAITRLAGYKIAMIGNTEQCKLARTYFSQQTIKQEELEKMTEEQKRLFMRREIKNYNSQLNETASLAGVENFGKFHNSGYFGLYRMSNSQIQRKKGISGNTLDFMGATELAANMFRITQTDEKLKKDSTKGEDGACSVHYNIGTKVRNTIKEIGGTMPEDLPPEEDIKKVERRVKKQDKIKQKKPLELEKLETEEDKFKGALGNAANPKAD